MSLFLRVGLKAEKYFSSGQSPKTWKRKSILFQTGHETYPTYHNEQIQRVIHQCSEMGYASQTGNVLFMEMLNHLEKF